MLLIHEGLCPLRADKDHELARSGNSHAQETAAAGVMRRFVGSQQRAAAKTFDDHDAIELFALRLEVQPRGSRSAPISRS
jgi:hypothetical protein